MVTEARWLYESRARVRQRIWVRRAQSRTSNQVPPRSMLGRGRLGHRLDVTNDAKVAVAFDTLDGCGWDNAVLNAGALPRATLSSAPAST